MNTFAPTPSFKNTACEFIHNLYFATLNDVVLIAAVQLFGFQCHLQLVNKIALDFVVEIF